MKRPHLRIKTHRDSSVSYWYDHGGKPRRWESLGKDEARALAKYEQLVNAPKPSAGTVDRMLAEAIEAHRGKIAPGTLRNYNVFRRHLAAVFRDPLEVTQADVLRYLRECPRMSFRGEVSLLSLGFVHWMDRGLLTFNPCFGVHVRRKGSKRKRLLAAAELDAIIAAADERLTVAIELGYAIGLRIGDLCALRWADVAGIVRTQKTDAPLAIEASDVLDTILARARALQARVASLYVLCDRRGKRLIPDTLRKHWREAAKRAGVRDTRFHDLRAAGATAIEKKHGVEAAREFLGHKDARTTLLYLRDLRVSVIRPIQRKA